MNNEIIKNFSKENTGFLAEKNKIEKKFYVAPFLSVLISTSVEANPGTGNDGSPIAGSNAS